MINDSTNNEREVDYDILTFSPDTVDDTADEDVTSPLTWQLPAMQSAGAVDGATNDGAEPGTPSVIEENPFEQAREYFRMVNQAHTNPYLADLRLVFSTASDMIDAPPPVGTNAAQPQTDATTPMTAAAQPQTDATTPMTAAAQPQTDATTPMTPAAQPQTNASTPMTAAAQPQTDATTPRAAESQIADDLAPGNDEPFMCGGADMEPVEQNQTPAERQEAAFRTAIERNLEGVPRLENLTPQELYRFRVYQEQLLRLLPVLRIHALTGDRHSRQVQALQGILEREENPDRRRLIEQILAMPVTQDRREKLAELKAAYPQGSETARAVDGLLTAANDNAIYVRLIGDIEKSHVTTNALRQLLASTDNAEINRLYVTLTNQQDLTAEQRTKITDNYARLLIDQVKSPDAETRTTAINRLRRLYAADAEKTRLVDQIVTDPSDANITALENSLTHRRQALEPLLGELSQRNFELTMAAYPHLSSYLRAAVPRTVLTLARDMRIGTNENREIRNTFPDDCPIQLPQVQAGDRAFPAIWEGFMHSVHNGQARLELGERSADLLRNPSQFAQLVRTCDWWTEAEEIIARNQRINEATQLNRLLREDFGVGAGWEMPPVTDRQRLDAWYLTALRMSNLMHRMRNYTQAYKTLEGVAPDITRDAAINELRQLGATIEFDRHGKLTRFVLPMPENLDLSIPENAQKIRNLEQWLERHRGPVDRAVEAYRQGMTSFLRYGDFVEHPDPLTGQKPQLVYDRDDPNRLAMVLDNRGRPQTIFVDQGGTRVPVHRNNDGRFFVEERTRDGQVVRRELRADMDRAGRRVDYDYTSQSFSAQTVTDARTGEPRIRVTATRLYCQDGYANYQYLGSEIDSAFNTNLSRVSTVTETRDYRPDEYIGVVHNTTGRMELLRADDLNGWWRWRQQYMFHYGAKVANIGLDVGLVVTGTAEALAAKSTLAAVLPTARVLIGATGFLAPALRTGAIRPFGLDGNEVLKWRHYAMMVDVYGIGLGGSALRLFTGGAKAGTATMGVLESIAHYGHLGTNLTGFLYAPAITAGISSTIDQRFGTLPEQRLPRAQIERGIAETDYNTLNRYNMQDAGVRRQTGQMLDSIGATVLDGVTSRATTDRVNTLVNEAKEILALNRDDPRRQAFVERLVGYHQPSAANILAQRMQANPERYTQGRLENGERTVDDTTRANRDLVARLAAEPTLGDISDAEKLLASQLLLLLAANNDGTMPASGRLATRTVELAGHSILTRDEDRSDEEWREVPVGERRIEQTVTVDNALAHLRRQMTTSPRDQVERLAAMSQADGVRYLRQNLDITEADAGTLMTRLRSGDAATRTNLIERLEPTVKAQQLVACDYLWRLGRVTNREMAALCLDIVRNPRLPESLRARAIVDGNGYRLAHLLVDMRKEEQDMMASSRQSLEPHLANINGSRVADIERTLMQLITADGRREGVAEAPSDLRALVARVMMINNTERPSQRLEQLEEIARQWGARRNGETTFAAQLVTRLQASMTQPVQPVRGLTMEQVQREKLEATVMLASLGRVRTAQNVNFDLSATEYNTRLLECISRPAVQGRASELSISTTAPEITHEVLRGLRYQDLTLAQRQQVVALLDTPIPQAPATSQDRMRRRDVELAKVAILSNMDRILTPSAGVTTEQLGSLRNRVRDQILVMFNAQQAGGNNSIYAGECPELKMAAIRTVRDIGWSDARVREMLEDRLYRGPRVQGSTEMIFYEQSAAVRRLALEALYRINPQNPGQVAIRHRDFEQDPAVGRLARSEEGRRELQTLGDQRQISEVAQRIAMHMDRAYRCNTQSGNTFLENSDFRILKQRHLDSALRGAGRDTYGIDPSGSLQDGYYAVRGFSFGVLWDRVSEFDWNAPDRRLNGAFDGVWGRYRPLSIELTRLALTPGGNEAEMERQANAINAMAYLLENNCNECRDVDQHTIRMNLASAMRDLCGAQVQLSNGRTVVIPQKVRDMAATHIQNLLTSSQVNSSVRLILLDGLRILHADGAIDTAQAAEVCTTVLTRQINAENLRTPGQSDRIADEQLHMALLEDLMRFRARAVNPMGVIQGCADNHCYNSSEGNHVNVRQRAQEILGLLRDGVTLTRDDAMRTPDVGTAPDVRAQNLEAAIRTPGNNNDNIVFEIFKSINGIPVSDNNDPRVAILVRLANDHQSLRVRAAAAHALIDIATTDGQLALMGFSILQEISRDNSAPQGLKFEATERLRLIERIEDRGRPFLDNLTRFTDNRRQGVLQLIWESEAGPGRQRVSADDARARQTALAGMIQQERARTATPNSIAYVRAITEAWAASDFRAPSQDLLRTTRDVLNFSRDPQARLAAAYVLMRSEGVPQLDKQFATQVAGQIRDNGPNDHIKNDARAITTSTEGRTTVRPSDELLRSASALQRETDFLARNSVWIRNELERIVLNTASTRNDISRLRGETARLQGETERLRAETARINTQLAEGVSFILSQASEDQAVAGRPVADRVRRLNEAIRAPGERNDNLVRAIFESVLGNPIENRDDARIRLLLDLGHHTSDSRVQEAVGMALLMSRIRGEGSLQNTGIWMLADVQSRGLPGQIWECKMILDRLAERSAQNRTVIGELYREARQRHQAAALTFQDTIAGPGRQPRVTDEAEIRRMVTAARTMINDRNVPGRQLVRALSEAWAAGEFRDPTGELLPLCRTILNESRDEQAQLTAAFCMVMASSTCRAFTLADMTLLENKMRQLKDRSGNPYVVEDATMLFDTLAEARRIVTQRQATSRQEVARINTNLGSIEERVRAGNLSETERQAIIRQVDEMSLALDRATYRLPPTATRADVDAARQRQLLRDAEQLGVRTNQPTADIQRQVEEVRNHRMMCSIYRVDPATTTRADLERIRTEREAAQRRTDWQRDCTRYRLDPANTTQQQMDETRNHHMWCSIYRIDPFTTSRQEIINRQERTAFVNRCGLYGLNPDSTTPEQLETRARHVGDCRLYNLDPDRTTPVQLEARRFQSQCEFYGLNHRTATRQELDTAIERFNFRMLCQRYRLPESTTTETMHRTRCTHFSLPVTTTAERLNELEIQENFQRRQQGSSFDGFETLDSMSGGFILETAR